MNRPSDLWTKAFDNSTNTLRTNNISGSAISTGIYQSTATTYTSGASVPLHTDVNGNALTSEGTLRAGEDLALDLQKVETRYAYTTLTSITTLTVRSAACFLHRVVIGMPSCPTITLYDSTTPSGVVYFRFQAGYPVGSYEFNQSLATGLTADATSGGVIPFVSFSSR